MSIITRRWVECDSCESLTEFRGSDIPVKGWAIAYGQYGAWEAWICPTCVPGFKTLNEAVDSTSRRGYPAQIDSDISRDPYAPTREDQS